MKFITLNRPDIITSSYDNGQKYVDFHTKQKPVTINPEYIVSMVEKFDSSKEFESTELYLSNGIWYDVTSRIEDIVKRINGTNSSSCSHAPEAENKHNCILWDFGRHECGIGIGDCPDSRACDFFDID